MSEQNLDDTPSSMQSSRGLTGVSPAILRALAEDLIRLSNQVAADHGPKPTRVRLIVEYDCHSGGGH